MATSEKNIQKENKEQRIIPSVQIVLTRQGNQGPEIFLMHRIAGGFQGQWGFPGGKVDSGETTVEAACRELFEETGVKINKTDLKLFRTTNSLIDRLINDQIIHCNYQIQVFTVFGENLSPVNASPEEHDQGQWFPLTDALELHQQALEKAFRNGENISADSIPNAIAPKTLETIKMLENCDTPGLNSYNHS